MNENWIDEAVKRVVEDAMTLREEGSSAYLFVTADELRTIVDKRFRTAARVEIMRLISNLAEPIGGVALAMVSEILIECPACGGDGAVRDADGIEDSCPRGCRCVYALSATGFSRTYTTRRQADEDHANSGG